MRTVSSVVAATVLAVGGLNAEAGPNVYIPLGEAGQVQIVDVASARVAGIIPEVGNAHGLAITPDGRQLVAGSYREEAAAGSPPRPAGVSEEEHARHHAMPATTGPAASGTSFVSIIDVLSGKVTRRVAVRGAVHHVAISPDGRLAVTTHPGGGGISVIDLAGYRVIATVATGTVPNYAVFSPDGRELYVSNAGDDNVSEIDVESWSVKRRLAAGKAPEHLVLSRDGRTLYTNNVGDGTASVISLISGRVLRTFPIGAVPHGIDLSADAGTLFATSMAENKIVAIDLAQGTRRERPLSPAPYHLAAIPGGSTLLVSSRQEHRIWVIDATTLLPRGEITISGIGHQMAVATR